MPFPSNLDPRGGVAVITGAAGGIGAALALQLADRSCRLALADFHAAVLADTRAQARRRGVTVRAHALDLAAPEAATTLRDAVLAAYGRATLLVNNAGVTLGGAFWQVDEAAFPPEDAAARTLQGIERREPRVLAGKDAERAAWVQRLFPVGYWKRVASDIARCVGRPAWPSSKESR